MNPEIKWQPTDTHYSLNSPNAVERAYVGRYELIAFDIQWPRQIGWKIGRGRNFAIIDAEGTAPDFATAKVAASAVAHALKDIPPETLRKPVTAPRHRSAS